MAQFAYFNSAVAAPSPVIGWYDTALFDYPTLPPSADLHAVTDAQWSGRLTNPSGWAVSAGELVAYTPPAPAPTLAQQAAAASVAGIEIALNGSITLAPTPFPTDPNAQSAISMMNQMALAGTLPTGFAAYEMVDANGLWHEFTAAQYQKIADAIADFVAVNRLIAAGNPRAPTSLPFASITITV
jgi:hypothetical protein